MPTKNTSSAHPLDEVREDELRAEYDLDYSGSTPNRFAAKLKNTTTVVLQPDVAAVFQSADAVNELLRSAIAATGAGSTKVRRPNRSSRSSGRHAG